MKTMLQSLRSSWSKCRDHLEAKIDHKLRKCPQHKDCFDFNKKYKKTCKIFYFLCTYFIMDSYIESAKN